LRAIKTNTGAQFEISFDGVLRTYFVLSRTVAFRWIPIARLSAPPCDGRTMSDADASHCSLRRLSFTRPSFSTSRCAVPSSSQTLAPCRKGATRRLPPARVDDLEPPI
jgi:hypothetical protein